MLGSRSYMRFFSIGFYYLIYNSCHYWSYLAFSTFNCVELERGVHYLEFNTEVKCDSPRHLAI